MVLKNTQYRYRLKMFLLTRAANELDKFTFIRNRSYIIVKKQIYKKLKVSVYQILKGAFLVI